MRHLYGNQVRQNLVLALSARTPVLALDEKVVPGTIQQSAIRHTTCPDKARDIRQTLAVSKAANPSATAPRCRTAESSLQGLLLVVAQ